jgi:hypothetical protein
MYRAMHRIALTLAAAGAALALTVPAAVAQSTPGAGRAPSPSAGADFPCYPLDRPYWPPKAVAGSCAECNEYGHQGAVRGDWEQWKCMRNADPSFESWELYVWRDACPRCRIYLPDSFVGGPFNTDGGLQFNR